MSWRRARGVIRNKQWLLHGEWFHQLNLTSIAKVRLEAIWQRSTQWWQQNKGQSVTSTRFLSHFPRYQPLTDIGNSLWVRKRGSNLIQSHLSFCLTYHMKLSSCRSYIAQCCKTVLSNVGGGGSAHLISSYLNLKQVHSTWIQSKMWKPFYITANPLLDR